MKKKLIGLLLIGCLFLSGCGKTDSDDVIASLTKNIDNAKSYYIEGKMEIINNEDIYEYDVKVSYKKDDMFKVDLTNKSNNHEQVILRNSDGVYVVTPSLNKSFKFQSEWPYNNSQVYLLQSILKDLKNDSEKTFEEKDGYYLFTSKVNYPNNKKLTKQVVFIDKNTNIKEVQVLDDTNTLQMKMVFDKTDMKASFDDNYFALNENLETSTSNEEVKEVTKIEDVIYPMYLPVNTYLSSKEVIAKEKGERLILTFDGDNPFMLIEETAHQEEEHTVIPTYGEPELLIDTIASVSDTSVNWVSNGIEYYLVSEILSTDELLEVARSVSTIPVSK